MTRCFVICVTVLASAASCLLICPGPSNAQQPQPVYVIDKPTAGILPDGSYWLRGRAGPESSFLVGAYVGFHEVLQIGTSFGMQKVFDRGTPAVNDYPGFMIRVRLLQETGTPALAIGFDSQGQGLYHEGAKRYDRKSTGFYAVLSKNYSLVLGELSLHGGVAWSTERKDDSDPNIFGATEWTILQRLSFLIDMDAALNDNAEGGVFGQGGIYIDVGAAWYAGESVRAAVFFRDLTGNFGMAPSVGREFELSLIQSF